MKGNKDKALYQYRAVSFFRVSFYTTYLGIPKSFHNDAETVPVRPLGTKLLPPEYPPIHQSSIFLPFTESELLTES
jgi:hypothetical protein